MGDVRIAIELPETGLGDANIKIAELRDLIGEFALSQGTNDYLKLEIAKNNRENMDFGSTLILTLGTPAAIAVAQGIYSFISKLGDRVVLKTEEGEVVATGDGASNINVAAVVENLRSRKNK